MKKRRMLLLAGALAAIVARVQRFRLRFGRERRNVLVRGRLDAGGRLCPRPGTGL